MTDSQARQSYSATARFLHWVIAGMLVLQFLLAQLAERADHADRPLRELALLAQHKSVGLTILTLAVVRLLWRLRVRPPPLPVTLPRWQILASRTSHWSFYALLFAMPVTGWLMSSASAYSVSWFHLFQVPDPVAPDPALKELLEEVHETLAKLLLFLAAVHVVAALWHGLVKRDGVLRRMATASGLGLFVAVIVTGALLLARDVATPGAADSQQTDLQRGEPVAAWLPASSPLPRWDIDYTTSFVEFTGDQSGASFRGRWRAWEADIRFSPTALGDSVFDVTVQSASADTRDVERDTIMAEPEWFDASTFPQVRYRANNFVASDNGGFVAHGLLEVKGRSYPVDLNFTVTTDGDRQVLVGKGQPRLLLGNALLDRLGLGLGTGEWADTSAVGRTVAVDVRVEATVQPQ